MWISYLMGGPTNLIPRLHGDRLRVKTFHTNKGENLQL